ncbi:MAG TPA: adenylate/guanylate cyclase domain-containing protein [Melioribacteraceae bacterium]|nr:adenylate/guanylate cyclase domain-containing protein [Melioribacteraceae bacterium]
MDDKFSVLYVDDEEHNLISFKAAFRRDYNILTSKSAKEGIELLRHNNIGLIITDQRMPEMTGVQFLEKVVHEFPNTVRMILTGFSDLDAIIEAINSGRVYRYITKPWDQNELKVAIENAKQLYQLQLKNKKLIEELKNKVIEQEKILRLFEKYVPTSIVEKVLENGEETIFEGELRNVTILFCDLRGFTALCEKLHPRQTVNFLNTYYSLMTKCVKKHDGFVTQFVGDEVFAVFGAPISSNNNEENAVYCALDMIESLEELNNKFIDLFDSKVAVGIGINSGVVVAGNLGSEDRIEYSITGDTVNTGKRIETLTKAVPNSILISKSVNEKVKDLFITTEKPPVSVKGKQEELILFEVIGRK